MDGTIGQAAGNCRYSIVVPIFNEEEMLPALIERLAGLMDTLDGPAEAVLVNDGSRDRSHDLMETAHRRDPRFKVVGLSRNFGHQVAITAGMDFARGDAVIVIDADLQDPPEVIPELIARWKAGYDVVYAVRTARKGESVFKRATARLFYRVINSLSSVPMPLDVGDFRLVDRRALKAFLSLRERDRFVRGLFGWVGLKQTGVPYERHAREKGETKYPLGKMIRLAITGIIGFSDAPLRLAIWSGALISVSAMLYGFYIFIIWLTGIRLVEGWASTMVILSILGGVNLMTTGVIGLYVGRIHQEVKNRPLYIVDQILGLEAAVQPDHVVVAGGHKSATVPGSIPSPSPEAAGR